MASCDIQDETAAVVCHPSTVSPLPLSVSPGRVPYYGGSLPERHRQALFQQQKQRALSARRSRTTSWSHRLSHSFTLVSDDGISSHFSQESLLSPRLPVDGTSELSDEDEVDLSIHRTFWQLFRNNMFQFGLELLYATETALVTPILLKLGLPDELYSITWMVSPILGVIFTPIVGSMSDRCRSRWGRRRPFVLSFTVGMIIGLTLLLNGGDLGMLLGDTEDKHVIGLVITLLGIFLMDFSSNSGDCPARAYLIDVCSINDTEFALSLRTLLGGVGGGLGYILNGINWETTFLSVIGHQERIIFTMIGTLATLSFILNLSSIPEVPLDAITSLDTGGENHEVFDENTPLLSGSPSPRTKLMAGRAHLTSLNDSMPSVVTGADSPTPDVLMAPNGKMTHNKMEGANEGEPGSLKELFLSIIYMPKELAHLCVNHFLGWLSYLVVLLFFTDYMAQAVYKGDPTAPQGSAARDQYDYGVQIGCWGLCIFSFSCALTAGIYSKLSPYLSHRTVYVFGQLIFAVCTGSMALVVDSPIATMVLCSSFGVQFFILLTMPSCLITVYHGSKEYVEGKKGNRRGIGKDVACIGIQIFIAQIIDSTIVGPLVILFGSHLVIVLLSSFLAFLAAIYSSLFVTYEMQPKNQRRDEERDKAQV